MMQRLLSVNVCLTFTLIVLGGTVRTFGAGLSCPDWPLCFGQWIPPFDFQVLLEWGHRLLASVVGVVTLAIGVVACTSHDLRRRFGLPIAGMLLLLLLQAVMGGLTVLKQLHPLSVTLHLGLGLLFLGALLWLRLQCTASAYREVPHRPLLLVLLGNTLGVLYLQILLGGLVSSTHAGLVCPDFPTCFGEWVPPMEGLFLVQFLHRVGALCVALSVIATAWMVRRGPVDRALRGAMVGVVAMTGIQVSLGIGNVLFRLPAAMRIAHLAVAAALCAMVWVMWVKVRYARISHTD